MILIITMEPKNPKVFKWHFQTKKSKYTNIVFSHLQSYLVEQFLRLSFYKNFLKVPQETQNIPHRKINKAYFCKIVLKI